MTTKVQGTNGIEFPDGSVQSSAAFNVPSGAVVDFAMNSAPAGWLVCDGAAVSRTTYAALFAAIGTTWGAGDGSTTFNLPDMRGYFRRGVGTNSDGTAAGAFAAKQVDVFKAHTHGVTDPGHTHAGTTHLGAGGYGHDGGTWTFGSLGAIGSSGSGVSIQSTGDSVETRPRNIAVLTCIKV